ncbi:MAG: hypothetical protein OXG46_02950 [Chloroflexi bacterium]|nr:hypothetical protein [Chloroflexota bacterium]MCY3937823.1 hypothetical protein [Chloroflexota bacterium]
MRIDFLWYPDCPSHPEARELLAGVLRELDLEAEIVERVVESKAEAEELAFPGSPTIRVDGRDIDPEGARTRPALTCRTYQWSDGRFQPLPEKSLLIEALTANRENEGADQLKEASP